MDESFFPVTVTFWYRLPHWSAWAESRFTAPTSERALKVQQEHWDNLKTLDYELSARP